MIKMLYSYEIFDTCLLRACGSSLDVFDILAQRILGDAEPTSIVDFSKERVEGGSRARKSLENGSEEVSLEEIYEHCDFSKWTDVGKERILATELEIEKALLSPVASIREQIKSQRNSGGQIAFISDMYLPKDFILSVLKELGYYEDNDRLYISSETKKCKSTGHLFELVKSECNARYSKWIHYGDNLNSDVKVPRKYGIKTRRVQHNFTYYQSKLKDKDCSCSSFSIAYMATISKAIVHKYNDDAAVLFATDLIAPLYVSYVYYLLFDAQKRGLQHLYFCARDGYLLYQIAQKIEETCESLKDIDLNYLSVSRQSLYQPGFEYDDGSDSVKNQSDLCFRYFKEQGLTRDDSAIVDLRGLRKCHIAINNILKRYGANPVFAYYIEVSNQRFTEGEYDALLFGERFKRNPYNNYFIPSELFEQYFSITTQKRTASYTVENDKVVPVFEEEAGDFDYKKRCSEINNQVCMDFVQLMSCMNPSNFDFKSMFYAAVAVYSDFAIAPLYKYLKVLEDFVVSESPNNYYKLLKKRRFFDRSRTYGYWYNADKIYNSIFPNFRTFFLRLRISVIRNLRGR